MAGFDDGAHDDLQARLNGPLAKLALMVDDDWWRDSKVHDPRVFEFVDILKIVASHEQAIKIRAARILAWIRPKDLSPLNVPSWTAFVEEYSPWEASTTREYIRLAESKLEVVRKAAVEKMIDLKSAGRALKELPEDASFEQQLHFVEKIAGSRQERFPRAFLDVISGDEVRRVIAGRDLGRILIGWPAPVCVIDDYLIECHEQKLTNEQILEKAKKAPPKPERLDKPVPDWSNDPAEPLLGPWREPTDLHDAVRMLRELEWLLDKREVLLAMAYYLIKYWALWGEFRECENLEQFCIAHLGLGQRSFERYARRGLDHFQYPLVREEMEKGLTRDRADFVLDRVYCSSDHSVREWIELVRRLGRTEMKRAAREDRDVDLRKEYAPALAVAKDVEAIVKVAKEQGMGAAADRATETGGGSAREVGGDEPTSTGGDAARIAQHVLAQGATGDIKIAIRDDINRRFPFPDPDYMMVRPKLLAAADYVLATVVLPSNYGPRKIVEHDCQICQNSRCRRPTMRLHDHHIDEQRFGEDHSLPNQLGLCPGCHLRGIHSDWMRVVRIGDWLVWTYEDGEVVIMHSPVEWLTKEVPKRAA